MTDNPWIGFVIRVCTDFIISGGGALITAMMATGSVSEPNPATIIVAVATGLIAAARGAQKMLEPAIKS
jgi:hypothetical protein